MYETSTSFEKIKLLFSMLIPILITQLGMFSMVFFNTVLSGQYNASDLAGVAVGSAIWNPVFTGISSILLAISPIVAQKLGAKQEKEASASLSHGIYLAFAIGLLVIVLGILLVKPILNGMGLPDEVRRVVLEYLKGLSFGVIPLFVFNALRAFLYAMGNTRAIMFILLSSLPVNLFLNYALIYGKFGLPELGGAGAGYATSITYYVILGLTIWIFAAKEPFRNLIQWSDFKKLSVARFREILAIGIPMGLSTFFETSMFAVVTILISRFDVATIAAYQSALNIVSFLYMIPISISTALTVLVGYEAGARRYRHARAYSWLGMGTATAIAIFAGLLVVLFRYDAASLYSNDPAVIELTGHFLIYALFFMISDAIQVTALAALRGYKDVNLAFMMTLVAYWLICLPTGYILAHHTWMGATGYWIGLTAGLLAAGIALTLRLVYVQNRIAR
jgi:multidrug resistance protein, MATE family